MEEDEELEKIKRRKLREMMKRLSEETTAGMDEDAKTVYMDKPVEVTDSSFAQFIRKHPLVVVDCWAAWCGPCRMLAPIIDELAREYSGKILFGKLNVDENPQVASQYQIMSIPTLLVFKNGKLVDRIVGAMPKQVLEQRLKRHLL